MDDQPCDAEGEMESGAAAAANRQGWPGGGIAVSGEIRRLNIVYILSRDGAVEHPHLIRVHHHLRRGGIRLQDVKRWLADLRGKDIPDSYAWSYKRRYKTGYVWQDVMDDDLITPISDNEYVLKGSHIVPPPPSTTPPFRSPGRRRSSSFDQPPLLLLDRVEKAASAAAAEGEERQGKLPLESPMRRGRAPETMQIEQDYGEASPEPPPRMDQKSPLAVCPDKASPTPALSSPSPAPPQGSRRRFIGRSNSSGRVSILGMLSCRSSETVDAAHRPVGGRREREELAGAGNNRGEIHLPPHPGMNFRRSWSGIGGTRKKAGETAVQNATNNTIKPAVEPTRSQCEKTFDMPEKLQSHVKECRTPSFRGRTPKSDNFSDLSENLGGSERRTESSNSTSSSSEFSATSFILSLHGRS